MCNRGKKPYRGLTAKDVLKKIKGGYHLPQNTTHDAFYAAMQACWRHEPDRRPRFHQLQDAFQEISQHQDLSAALERVTASLQEVQLTSNRQPDKAFQVPRLTSQRASLVQPSGFDAPDGYARAGSLDATSIFDRDQAQDDDYRGQNSYRGDSVSEYFNASEVSETGANSAAAGSYYTPLFDDDSSDDEVSGGVIELQNLDDVIPRYDYRNAQSDDESDGYDTFTPGGYLRGGKEEAIYLSIEGQPSISV